MNHLPEQAFDKIPGSLDRITPLGKEAPTKCPRCKGKMELAQLDDQMVILCSECKGILVQSKVFGEIVERRRRSFEGAEAAPQPMDQTALRKKINCPGCGNPMDVHPYHGPSNVVIDSCSKCWFTFLDYGELSAIERAPGRR